MKKFIIDPKIVESYLSQPFALTAGETKVYTGQEKNLIRAESVRLYAQLTDGCTRPAPESRQFVLTAGAPGAGKTTLLHAWLKANAPAHYGVYVDPDETIMKKMIPFQQDLASHDAVLGTLEGAYRKWRWASNYVAGTILNRACNDGYNIVYGTTATHPNTGNLYSSIKNAGYESLTLIVAAPEDIRQASVRIRFEIENSRFIPEEDVTAKGKMFYQRLPLYFEKSDHFQLYWRDRVEAAPVLVSGGSKGRFHVDNDREMDMFDGDLVVEKTGLDWCKLVTLFLKRYPDNGIVPYVPQGGPQP
jgi:predicted ABC-type ATPase